MRMRFATMSVLSAACVVMHVSGAMGAGPTTAPAFTDVSRPFWDTATMTGESVLFIKPADGGQATASLLFEPTAIRSVTSSDGKTIYKEGQDYLLVTGSRQLTLPAGSAIPARTTEELTPPLGSQPFVLVRRDGKGDILFAAGHEYADMQTLVTYTYKLDAASWDVPPPRFAERELPRTIAILRQGAPLKLVLFGDSISTGCNASKWANTPPFQPAYGELLAANLGRAYRSEISFTNHSEGGRTSAWGLEHIGPVAAEKPDLVILAWGMNDSTGEGETCSAETFIANLKGQMAAVRAARPNAEFILVASMLPNKDWRLANPDRVLQYRDAMRKMVGPGIALADLSSVWEAMLTRKPHMDLTGNGVNHPNDFGHRLYAEVIFSLLAQQRPAR